MKNILMWIVTVFVLLLACATNIVGFLFGFVAASLIAPIGKWQELLTKFVKKPIKIIVIAVAIILMLLSFSSGTDEVTNNSSSSVNSSNSQQEIASSHDEVSSMIDDENEVSKESNVSINSSSVEEHIHAFTNATCTSPQKCSCGKTRGNAKGHSWSNATCTKAKRCSVCGEKEGSPIGHQYSKGVCTVCGEKDLNYSSEETSAESNSSFEAHVHSFAAATCTSPQKCSCGKTSGTAKGHNWTDATCTSPKTCIDCKAVDGAPMGHKYSNGSCVTCGAKDHDYVDSQSSDKTYIININNDKFHEETCRSLPNEENREYTQKSREELLEEGYIPCKICDP